MLWSLIRNIPKGWRAHLIQQSTIRCLTGAQFGTNRPCIAEVLRWRPQAGGECNIPLTIAGHVRTSRKQKKRTFIELGDGSTQETLKALVLGDGGHDDLSTGTAVSLHGSWQPAPPTASQAYELMVEELTIVGECDAKKFHSPEYLRTIPHLRLRNPVHGLLARMRSEADYHITRFFRQRDYIRVQAPIITSSDCEGAGEVFQAESPHALSAEAHRPLGGDLTEAEEDTTRNRTCRTDSRRKISHLAADGKDNTKSTDPHEISAFFGSPRFLTVSAQLHLEAIVHAHPRVWTLSPTFRAEKSDTPRHLSEFWMLEAELQTKCLTEIMDTVEDVLRYLIQELSSAGFAEEVLTMKHNNLQKFDKTRISSNVCPDPEPWPVSCLEERWKAVLQPSWPRITYSEAISRLQEASDAGTGSFTYIPTTESGLALEHERWLAEFVGRNGPVFVIDYPRSQKPFYMLPSTYSSKQNHQSKTANEEAISAKDDTVACFDLLFPHVAEVAGGSLREHRLPELQESCHRSRRSPMPFTSQSDARDLQDLSIADPSHASAKGEAWESPATLDWYLDLRRYGSVPHGGFGLGLDRFLAYLVGVSNIKDVVPWPRHHRHCVC